VVAGARRGRYRRSLCTCSSVAGARRCYYHHSLCTCSSPAGARKCRCRHSPCTGSSQTRQTKSLDTTNKIIKTKMRVLTTPAGPIRGPPLPEMNTMINTKRRVPTISAGVVGEGGGVETNTTTNTKSRLPTTPTGPARGSPLVGQTQTPSTSSTVASTHTGKTVTNTNVTVSAIFQRHYTDNYYTVAAWEKSQWHLLRVSGCHQYPPQQYECSDQSQNQGPTWWQQQGQESCGKIKAGTNC